MKSSKPNCIKLAVVLRVKHRKLSASKAITQDSPFHFQLHWPKTHDLKLQTIYIKVKHFFTTIDQRCYLDFITNRPSLLC